MVRNPSIIACCAALIAIPAEVSAQSFEETVQSALDAERVGSSLSKGANFGTGEKAGRRGAFDRQMPDVHLETEVQPGIDWWKPTLDIGGAKVSPDIKKKGLKVAIPVELIQSGQSLVADRDPGAD